MQEEEKKEQSPPPDEVEQQLNTASNDETIAPTAADNTADTPLPTTKPEQEKDNMEVHHHAHHEHGKKNWRNYFWEFLMLFLAVFCGFLAEYQLEHKIERDRAKQFVHSFYEDLVTDTTRLNDMMLYDDDKIAALGQMKNCYDSIRSNSLSSDCIRLLILHSRANRAFSITDRTITQLANAGGFRLLSKQDADSISSYINKFKEYQDFQTTVFQESQDNVRNTLNELLDFNSAYALMQTPMPSTGTITSNITAEMVSHGSLLFSNNAFLLNKWFNQLSVYLRITKRQLQQLADLKEKAKGLIVYFKKQHDLI